MIPERAKPEESVWRVMGSSGSKWRRIGVEVNRTLRRSKADCASGVHLILPKEFDDMKSDSRIPLDEATIEVCETKEKLDI
jgi:hypothetical protein